MRALARAATRALVVLLAGASVACGLEVVGTFDTRDGASATQDGGGRDGATSADGSGPNGDGGATGPDGGGCTGASCPCSVDAGTCPEAGTPVTLTVVVNGTTTPAAVTAVAQGLSCPGGLCAVTAPAGTTVQLTAHPLPDETLVAWSLPACGRELTCPVVVDGPLTVAATFAPLKHYTHSTDKLYAVNGATGALGTPVSFQNCSGTVYDIAIDRSGNAFVANNANLYRLNLQTASCTQEIGSLGTMCVGLTFMPDPNAPSKDVLVAGCGKSIYRVDTTNASKTLIGTLDGDWSVSGDLAFFPNHGLYATVTEGGKDSITKLDPTNADMLVTKSTGLDDLYGLGWRGDALLAYGINAVYAIDPATGASVVLNANTTINAFGGATGP